MNKIDRKEVLDIAEEAAWLTVCLCEESGNEALKTTNAYVENKKALRYIREHQRIESEEPNMDAIKTREINVLVKENNVLREALSDFVRDAEFRACENSTPGALLRLAKGRSALANPCRPDSQEAALRSALKETLDCLINETSGNHDTPWVESVKNHANTVLANAAH